MTVCRRGQHALSLALKMVGPDTTFKKSDKILGHYDLLSE